MRTNRTANAIGEQLHGQPKGNLENKGGRILTNNSSHSHGVSHICKDKWRTRANAKDLVVVRKKYQEIH